MEEKDFDFEVKYNEIKEKYGLPELKTISEDFDVEKVAEKKPVFLAREMRRIMNEKILAYLQLFENLINPNSPPMFMLSILKNVSEEDKNIMRNIYKKLSSFQIKSMKLDTVYNETNETKFINDVFKMWQDLKLDIYKIIENFSEEDKEKGTKIRTSYFG